MAELIKDEGAEVVICAACCTEFHMSLYDTDNFYFCPYCGEKFCRGEES